MNRPPLQLFGPGQVQQSKAATGPASDQDTACRQQFIRCESAIKMVGYLYVIAGLLLFVPGVLLVWMMAGERGSDAVGYLISSSLTAFGIIVMALGVGLYRLKYWARAIGMILSGFSVFTFVLKFVFALMLFFGGVSLQRSSSDVAGFSIIAMVFAMIGFVVSLGILNLLRSNDAQSVCTEWYASVVARTKLPKQNHAATWIFILAIAILVGSIAYFQMNPLE